jgi:hypothetical protein
MIQNILVYMIIATTLAYVIFGIVKNLNTKKTGHCGGCDGCSFKKEFQAKLSSERKLKHFLSSDQPFKVGNMT